MAAKSNLVTDRQKAVIETMRLHLNEQQSIVYLKSAGHEMSVRTWYREKNKLEKMKLQRLYHIAKIGFEDQHLQTIDELEMSFKMLWNNVLRERDPYKQNSMIKDIIMLKPYLSAYYEATKFVVEKQPIVLEKAKEYESKQSQQQQDSDNLPTVSRVSTIDDNRKF